MQHLPKRIKTPIFQHVKDANPNWLVERYKELGSVILLSKELRAAGYIGAGKSQLYRLFDERGYEVAPKGGVRKNSGPKKLPEKVKPIVGGMIEPQDVNRVAAKGTRFVFTSAQNNTLVHEKFLQSLKVFCNERNAELFISRFSYNKSGFQNGVKDGDSDELFYDKRIKPYQFDTSMEITPSLIFCGELNILPTAENPLSGFDNYTRQASAIIPHSKVQMKSVATMPEDQPKILYTTGAVTLRNYIQKKAGQKADFHHVFGATYVEIAEDGTHFVRQLIADDSGEFYDLTDYFTPYGVQHGNRVEAINYGDIHIEKIDTAIAGISFHAPDSMLNTLRPRFQLVHDIIDFSARNHHNIKDPFHWAKMYHEKKDKVEDCIAMAAGFLNSIQRDDSETIVVESNHDLALKKWLSTADVTYDPVNAQFFHRASHIVHTAIEGRIEGFSIFEHLVREFPGLERTKFLRENDSFQIAGNVECGLHGHLGPNGARGNPRNLRHLGRKANTGHTHSAGIVDGVYTAGVTGTLDMGYNKGPSSWSHSHIVTYPNGKRTIITIKNGKWRA